MSQRPFAEVRLPASGPTWIAALVVLAILPAAASQGSPVTASGPQDRAVAERPPRVVAIGDIHGAYDEFTQLLRAAGLVDDELHWAGGNTILVQTGDFTDRGAGVRRVMDLLRRLEQQAPQVGGEVLISLGNHEVMNVVGEIRDVTPEIMGRFAADDAEDVREDGYDEFRDRVLEREPVWDRLDRRRRREVKDNWIAEHPLGHVEYLRALGPDGDYGRWIRELPFALVVQDVLFLHAGIVPELAERGVAGLNDRIAREIDVFDAYRRRLYDDERITSFADLQDIIRAAAQATDGLDWLPEREAPLSSPPELLDDLDVAADDRSRFQSLFYLSDWFLLAPEGPMWTRVYANWPEAEGMGPVEQLVRELGVRAIVVGHTPQPDGIRPRFGNRVFLIDTGMLTSVYGGKAMALEIDGDEFATLLSDGTRRALVAPPPLAAPATLAAAR